MNLRKPGAYLAYALIITVLIKSLAFLKPIAGISKTYNIVGPEIAPNIVSTILFDFRGYDTLGECIILVGGVLALSMLYGRGQIDGDVHESAAKPPASTNLLSAFALTITPLIIALGIYITLGGHITPGGGFQGGSIVAAGIFMATVLAGRKTIKFNHDTLIKLESLGLGLYIILGFMGWLASGYYLYNLGVDAHGIATSTSLLFNYPDGLNAGIIPYLNVAVLLKVSAGLTTALLIILEGKK